jgi:site-specific DNA-methyltransferase (adenine-specific)
VGLIVTDPPYKRESISLYSDLAGFASRVLVPGGLCFCYAPVLHLPDVLDALRGGLRYVALLALVQADWGCGTLQSVRLMSNWKPLVMMCQGPIRPWWQPRPDRLMHPGGRSKTYSPHEQAESECAEIVEHFSRPGALVCDPFLGSGTTGVICHRLGRKFCGFEINRATARRAAGRIKLAGSEAGG